MLKNNLLFKTLLLFSVQIFNGQLMLSQDSIFFIDRTTISGKVTEINKTEVNYYKSENISGPKYTVLKNSIAFIKYADNFVDSFGALVSNPIKSGYPKLETRDRSVYCYTKKISDHDLLELLKEIKDPLQREKLIDEFNLMKHYQKRQILFGVGGTLFFGTSLFYGLIFGSISSSLELFIGAAIFGAAVFIPATVFSFVNKKKYLKQMKVLANSYNSLK